MEFEKRVSGDEVEGIEPVVLDTAVRSKNSEIFHVSDESLNVQRTKPSNRVTRAEAGTSPVRKLPAKTDRRQLKYC